LVDTYDWWNPWLSLLKLVNLIICHAFGVLAIAAIMVALEIALTQTARQPLVWTAEGVTVSLSDIVHYGDMFIFIVFFVVALIDIVKWARAR
jgi:hypothetical protein